MKNDETTKCCGRDHPQPGCNCCACREAAEAGKAKQGKAMVVITLPVHTTEAARCHVFDAKGQMVADCGAGVGTYVGCNLRAAQIVKALNSHDKLVEACDKGVMQARAAAGGLRNAAQRALNFASNHKAGWIGNGMSSEEYETMFKPIAAALVEAKQ